jgi:hypothetical protein
MAEYIYLIREREFIKSNEQIYKIGKSKQENCKRTKSYPKGSILECVFRVDDCNQKEKDIITLLTTKYKRRKDIGNEYFEGDRNEMIKDIIPITCNVTIQITPNKTYESNPIYKFFNENYEITNDDSDYIEFNAIYDKYIKENDIQISKIALSKQLTKVINIKPKLKRIGDNPITIFQKIKNKLNIPIQ